MSNLTKKLSQSHDVSAKVAQVLKTRSGRALERFNERAQQAREQVAGLTNPASLSELRTGPLGHHRYIYRAFPREQK